MEVARLVLRQDPGSEADTTPACEGSNAYDGRMGVRISAIFVILVGSTWGKLLFLWHIMYSVFSQQEVNITPSVLDLREISQLIMSHTVCHILMSSRCYLPDICQTCKDQTCTGLDILCRQILRFWGHHRYCIHSFARPRK